MVKANPQTTTLNVNKNFHMEMTFNITRMRSCQVTETNPLKKPPHLAIFMVKIDTNGLDILQRVAAELSHII
nr:unnamed protein product [Callosobruchus analis]